MRHFLSLTDAGPDAIAAMLADALDRKAARAGWAKGRADADAPLAGHVLACVFVSISAKVVHGLPSRQSRVVGRRGCAAGRVRRLSRA